MGDDQFASATAYRERLRAHLGALLGHDGVLVVPTLPDIALLRSDDGDMMESYRNRSIPLLCLAGLSGFPQLSMPLGLSLLGPAGSDLSLVRLAERIAVPAA